jgi:hypothetical protein
MATCLPNLSQGENFAAFVHFYIQHSPYLKMIVLNKMNDQVMSAQTEWWRIAPGANALFSRREAWMSASFAARKKQEDRCMLDTPYDRYHNANALSDLEALEDAE